MSYETSYEQGEASSTLQKVSERNLSLPQALIVLLSIVVRLFNIHSPLLENHGFRQTQTAITVWSMVKEGITFLHYKTPVLGAPWQIPFEFPTYQVTAALLAKTGLELDVACRVTSLLYFYLSALILYRLCLLFYPRIISWWVLGFYLWCPFMIVWSRACMIDYASVSFALAYLYFLLVWTRTPRRIDLFAAILLCGCLGYLTKITTMPIVYPAIAWIIWQRLPITKKEKDSTTEKEPINFAYLALLATALVLPLAIGIMWVHYTDQVKAQSPFTSWLVSANLKEWNFGSIAQRLQIASWRTGGTRLLLLVMPPAIAGVWQAYRAPIAERAWFWTSLFGIALPILVFFNLYFVHDYYYIAVSPFVAVTAGYGMYTLWHGMSVNAKWLRIVVVCLTLFSLYKSIRYLPIIYKTNYDNYIYQVGKAIQASTPEGSYVLIEGYDWDSSLLYYARRKGLMIKPITDRKHVLIQDYAQIVHSGYTTYVCRNAQRQHLTLWKYHKLITTIQDFEIYQVGETPF